MDTERVISTISPLLFSGFAEHMGRCIYEGIYDPTSPHADENGLRKDVLAALHDLNFRSIRYPGGNFLSGYHWQDGIGARDQRPRRRELAWQSIETNQFGTDEFMAFCRAISAEPMLGVNMGTGTLQDAAHLVEYCNAPAGSHYADMRVANGQRDPYGVKYWCLGNEMDGQWQIGHLSAEEYGKKAREAAKMMRWHDASIQLVLCGSSNPSMATYPEWDRVALELCWEQVEYHSIHYYARNLRDDTASFLALSAEFETYVDTLAGILRYVKAKNRSKRDVYLSWDEWNVWYKNMEMKGNWTQAPHLIEEIYNLEDALVIAQWLNVFLRKADVLKIACLAQIVNVIAPILTTKDALLKQSIFYPFQLFSQLAAGNALDVLVKSPLYPTAQFGDMPLLDVSASYDEAHQSGAVFIVNRSQTERIPTELRWHNHLPCCIGAVHQIAGTNPKATNTFEKPDTIVPITVASPKMDAGSTYLVLPPLSFTALEVVW
jgi:alpha-N-arabinofuranosidase